MITLDISPQQQAIVERESKRLGMSIEQYITNLIDKYARPKSTNSMVERIKQMPKPTSYNPKKAVSIQRELRNEWD